MGGAKGIISALFWPARSRHLPTSGARLGFVLPIHRTNDGGVCRRSSSRQIAADWGHPPSWWIDNDLPPGELLAMVQVDVFWSYGIGSTFAVAACRQLAEHHREGRGQGKKAFDNGYFTNTLLFLSILFAPSGMYLLWAFPSWETMHAGDRDLPAWLVTGFAITNITQGILGFWLAYRLIVARRVYVAYLTIIAAYFGMFFILVHGLDGTGYQSFFSATREDFLHWAPMPPSA